MGHRLAVAGHFRPAQFMGGVASSWQNLLRGMAEVKSANPRYADLDVTVFHSAAGVPHRCEKFAYREMHSRFGRFGSDFRYGLMESGRFDASLFPNYFRPPVVRSRRSVAVIHDLLYKNMPHLISWRQRKWLGFAQQYALKKCDAIITISQDVKEDILRWFGDRWADKIHPIWNSIAFGRLDGPVVQTASEGRPYLLGVAVDRPHKNLSTLIRAFAKLRPRFPEHCLVLVGELRSRRPKGRIHAADVAAKMPPTVDLVNELGLGDHVKITGFVSDEELGALYRGAEAFVLPSLFEGFGMPPIEAMALGAPTVVTDIPVMREVTLGAAHYLDKPQDVDAVADMLGQILADPNQARPTLQMQAEVRRRFAPATIAEQYLNLLFED